MTFLLMRKSPTLESYVQRKHYFPGMELIIREFSFHQLNANLLWPGTFAFEEWYPRTGGNPVRAGNIHMYVGLPLPAGIFSIHKDRTRDLA
ncbi:unnamed protein product [Lupinus luteus]|uniref:Uncharacterized protein n=1 Tax=Lupinus luteus TaxID=3873 RepID=A0AAV1XUL1_LUPLU